jgi:hypothetical protein
LSAFLCCQNYPGVSIPLLSGFSWYPHFSVVRIFLVSAFPLLSGFFLCQYFSVVRLFLVSAFPLLSGLSWCQHFSVVSWTGNRQLKTMVRQVGWPNGKDCGIKGIPASAYPTTICWKPHRVPEEDEFDDLDDLDSLLQSPPPPDNPPPVSHRRTISEVRPQASILQFNTI